VELYHSDAVCLLIGFLMYTGARRHEMFTAEWPHINLQRNSWYMPVTKNGKPRYVTLDCCKPSSTSTNHSGCSSIHAHTNPIAVCSANGAVFAMSWVWMICAYTICGTASQAHWLTMVPHSTKCKSCWGTHVQQQLSVTHISPIIDCNRL